MDVEVLRHPTIMAIAAVVGAAGLIVQLLAYRALRALKLKPGEPMPMPIAVRLGAGGFFFSSALVVYMLAHQ